MYSFHSSLEEKNQLLYTLTRYGIETTVDRSKKKDRIREWIQSSAIVEENEEESENDEEFEEEIIDDEIEKNEQQQNMKGRHFPERRLSVDTTKKRTTTKMTKIINNDNLRKKNVNELNRKKIPSINRNDLLNKNNSLISLSKPVERKIPFAPQVAEERKIVAKFASFPNGDPTLAFQGNGVDSNVDTRIAGSQSLINKSNSEFNELTISNVKVYPFNNEQLRKIATDSSSSSDKETIRFVSHVFFCFHSFSLSLHCFLHFSFLIHNYCR